MIVGLTGSIASGKGVVADFLKEKNFVYLSLSNELRALVSNKKIEITRENLQFWGNKLREENGANYLAKLVVERIKSQKYENVVVDGIRNPGELVELKKLKNFFLVSVDAPLEIRFKRAVERSRESDPLDYEGFLKINNKDLGIGESETGQGVGPCMKQADFKLINDGSFEEISEKVEKLYHDLQMAIPPLTWDEYFMTFAQVAAKKSKDPSTKVGACIVDQQNRVVGLGYNGFPKYCNDNSFPFERTGEFLETKYAYVVHAEPNAILNSTKDTHSCKMYVTLFPCNECAKLIIQAGIKEVIYLENKYFDTDTVKASMKLFNECGIKTRQFIFD